MKKRHFNRLQGVWCTLVIVMAMCVLAGCSQTDGVAEKTTTTTTSSVTTTTEATPPASGQGGDADSVVITTTTKATGTTTLPLSGSDNEVDVGEQMDDTPSTTSKKAETSTSITTKPSHNVTSKSSQSTTTKPSQNMGFDDNKGWSDFM